MFLPKFKGITFDGRTVIGDLRHGLASILYIGDEHVKPESVTVQVGFDENGKEIFIGDKLEYIDGTEFKVVNSNWNFADDSRCFCNCHGSKATGFKLKE